MEQPIDSIRLLTPPEALFLRAAYLHRLNRSDGVPDETESE